MNINIALIANSNVCRKASIRAVVKALHNTFDE